MKKLHGTGVALVTPFDENGSVDFSALTKLLRHTARGVDYWVVMGTTGEAATLSSQEKKAVLAHVIKNNRQHLPIVYGIGGSNTAHVIDELNTTDLAGVSAILSVSPAYNKPPQEGIVRHFTAVADASPRPLILYNVPGRTASNLTPATTLQLARHPNIVGIKEASGNFEQAVAIAKAKPTRFLLISGDDMLTVPLYSIGAAGVISVLANAYPQAFRKMKEGAEKGNFALAARALFSLSDMNGLMYEEGNPAGIKALLASLELCSPRVRLPLVEASADLQTRIKQQMQKL